ncbi:penicillin acylase family protein [Robiginitalea sp. IMCC43444]|uniref:penicillin acylase family protein n=1 Tax=Robiginitalea sp. IMCC43444 TaxID=3459121 RepID=UPI00404289D9
MGSLKKILRIVFVLLLLLVAGGFLAMQHLKPEYEGEVSMPGLGNEVSVYFDSFGIPHIYGQNETDAFRALGYVHAQDRLWQMELLRRVAKGRLSEVFGQQTLEADRFFLNLGIDEATNSTLENIDRSAPAFELIQAYLDGINHFIKEGPTPIEFYLTGLDKRPFELEDVFNSVGYMAFSFAMAHKTDPLLTHLKGILGEEYLQELLGDEPAGTTLIRNFDERGQPAMAFSLSSETQRILSGLPLPAFEGSNSWVIAPQKTKNNSVILANDPHIGFAQPSVWYEAHLVAPGYEKYGYHLAGIPFPMLGHDRNMAYGLTMFENDDLDFFTETRHPQDSNRYRSGEQWIPFEEVHKKIAVKDADTVSFTYKRTSRGPVVNSISDQMKDMPPVSMAWVYTQGENRVMDALYGISHSKGMSDFESAVEDIHAPGLNVMYGDRNGNVAWWAAARLYRFPDSISTKMLIPSDVSSAKRAVPFEENPRAVNPPWGYVYSANNQPDSTAAGFMPGYYLPENRAKRIVQLLEARDDWDREGVKQMITDNTSSVNPQLVADLAREIKVAELSDAEIECLDILNSWKGDYPLNSKEAVVFHRWVYFFAEASLSDEMGPEVFQAFLGTHLFKRMLARLAAMGPSLWWDDIRTPERIETKSELVISSFKKARNSVDRDFGPDTSKWNWGRVHTLEHQHPIGQIAALRSFFNVGPFPVEGSREVINNMAFPYDSTGFYKVNSGPSTRRVIDFSDIEQSVSILPTGQSGNPFSPHYSDQAERYNRGEFRKMLMNGEEIRTNSKSLLIFKSATD